MQAVEYSAEVFARNLRMQRAGMDISQRELAEKAGVDVTTVHKYEDGAMTRGPTSSSRYARRSDVLRTC